MRLRESGVDRVGFEKAFLRALRSKSVEVKYERYFAREACKSAVAKE